MVVPVAVILWMKSQTPRPDEEEGNESVNGKAVEEARVSDEEDGAQADEPDGACGETVARSRQAVGDRRGGVLDVGGFVVA